MEYGEANSNDDLRQQQQQQEEEEEDTVLLSDASIIQQCQQKAQSKTVDQQGILTMESIQSCIQDVVTQTIYKQNEELTLQSDIRHDIAAKLENYTCNDSSVGSSEPLRYEHWQGRDVKVMLDRPTSRIHFIHDFITAEECDAMEQAAEPMLGPGTVSDGKGGFTINKDRKALQAAISVPWHLEQEGNPIARLSRRVYDYTNHVLHMNISEQGQEKLMSIQYFGRGENDTEPDQYTPHCDGECNGMPHKFGTRMATMVMYW